MNRRKFLKRIAAVAVGSVVVPTALANKNTEDPLLLAFRRARKNTKFKKPLKPNPIQHTIWYDEFGHVPENSCIYFRGNRIFYRKELPNANNRKNNLHYQTQY